MNEEIGKFRDRILLRVRIDTPALDMGLDSLYANAVKRWARVEAVGAVAYAAGVQIDQRVTHRVHMRLFTPVTSHYEIVFSGWVFRVRRVKHDHKARRTIIEVEEERRGE